MAQASFNGVNIFVLADDVPRTLQADISIRHIPGGNVSYIDNAGPQLRQINYTLLFQLGSDMLAFEGQLGNVGLLSTFDGDFNALLLTMRRVAHGAQAGGECVAQCTFALM